MSTGRAAPFYCPYCGEETIVPEGERAWHCETCERTFTVGLISAGDVSSNA